MLVDAADLRHFVENSLPPGVLQEAIRWVEADLERQIGPPADGELLVTESVPGGYDWIFTKRRIATVSSVTEYHSWDLPDGKALTANTDYYTQPQSGMLRRIHGTWGDRVNVVYAPVYDKSQYRQAVIDLTRLFLDRKAFKSEGIANEMSYTAPDNWEMERQRVLARLQFVKL
jgi:hypothetical protein